MKLQNIIEEYHTTNKFKLIKRYRLLKKMRSLMDPVHFTGGSYSIIYTIIFK